MSIALVVDDETEEVRLARVLKDLNDQERQLEEKLGTDAFPVLLVRKTRFDAVMGIYCPPNPAHRAFRGPNEKQVDVTIFGPALRLYRAALKSVGVQLAALPNLREMGFEPYRPDSVMA